MKYRKHKIFLVGGVLLPTFLFSQEIPKDTTQVVQKSIDAIVVPQLVVREVIMPDKIGLHPEDIEALNVDDVAGLIAKSPGATVNTYGGLGGLKSVSIRGLGGQHTALLVDGFLISNAQAGQMNLGQLQADGVKYAKSGVYDAFYNMNPVSANFYGSFMSFSTFQRYRGRDGHGVKASFRYGSFMRREAYVQGDKKKGKWHVGAFGKYRDAQGNYPFEFINGFTESSGVRGNNDYQDIHFGFNVARDIKDKGKLKLIYRSSFIDQGLPGAVLFYNESADERMETTDHRVMIDYETTDWRNRYRLYLNAGLNELDYHDPSYLNAEGFLHDIYQNSNIDAGYIHYRDLEKIELRWGAEQKVESLQSNRETLGTPLRASSFGLFGAQKKLNNVVLEAIAGGQMIYDDNIEATRTHFQFTPNAFIRYSMRERLTLNVLYKRNFRLPSFNELYFGEIGNHDLESEIAHQVNAQLDWKIKHSYNRWHWTLKTDVYFNRVRNKIVAIPTKNLFVWSIQNVNEAVVYGSTLDTWITRRFNSDTRLEIMANYTWQRVIDITPDAITYGHQVAYAPEHLANADVMFIRKGLSARISNNFVSGRYALNENVPMNFLDPFWTMDVALGYKHELKGKHKIGVQFNVRNLTDVSYAFIRSFVMPGRHYLLTLNYEIF